MTQPAANFLAGPNGTWTVHFGDVPVGWIERAGKRFAVRFHAHGVAVPDTRHDDLGIAETYCMGVLARLTYEPPEEHRRAISH